MLRWNDVVKECRNIASPVDRFDIIFRVIARLSLSAPQPWRVQWDRWGSKLGEWLLRLRQLTSSPSIVLITSRKILNYGSQK